MLDIGVIIRDEYTGPTRVTDVQVPGEAPLDLVTVPVRQGLEAVDVLRLGGGVGPVLHDGDGATLGFLVPPNTSYGWDLPGSACAPTCHAPDAPLSADPPVRGTGWLVPPSAADRTATEPARLRTALAQAVRTIEALDRTR